MSKNCDIPLSLYVHLPWCVHKCPYCDFNSYQIHKQIPEKLYIEALLCDLKLSKHLFQDRPLYTIFIGGGTPSLFTPESIQTLLEGIHQLWTISADTEVTLEANPGTFEQERFKGFLNAGVNRLSLGAQSFNDNYLKKLGRIHSSQNSIHAVFAAQDIGFPKINIDLMYGLPNQTVSEALSDIEQALNLKTTHLSWYQLTIEPNTLFYKKPPQLPNDEILWTMQEQGQALIKRASFTQYEVSAYSHEGYECQHNVNYWRFGDYLGIGAGAHGKISDKNTCITRIQKHKSPANYLAASQKSNQHANTFIEHAFEVKKSEEVFEFMLNGLRLNAPLSLDLLAERTNSTLNAVEPILKEAIKDNLIQIEGNKIHKTDLGQRFLNNLMMRFL